MRRGDKYFVPLLQSQVVNKGDGKIGSQDLPGFAVVQRCIDTHVSADVQQAGPFWIFKNHIHWTAGDTFADIFPSFTKVGRAINVDLEVVVAFPIHRQVNGALVVFRGDDSRDPLVRDAVVDLGPLRAAIASHMNATVIGAGINDSEFNRRLG